MDAVSNTVFHPISLQETAWRRSGLLLCWRSPSYLVTVSHLADRENSLPVSRREVKLSDVFRSPTVPNSSPSTCELVRPRQTGSWRIGSASSWSHLSLSSWTREGRKEGRKTPRWIQCLVPSGRERRFSRVIRREHDADKIEEAKKQTSKTIGGPRVWSHQWDYFKGKADSSFIYKDLRAEIGCRESNCKLAREGLLSCTGGEIRRGNTAGASS